MARQNEEDFEIDDRIQAMVPEVILAVQSLAVATPEQIQNCLRQSKIDVTRSETEMALEYGCRLGIMEEKKRYRLNPELKKAIITKSLRAKRHIAKVKDAELERDNDNDDCYCNSYAEEEKDSENEIMIKRRKPNEFVHDDEEFEEEEDEEEDLDFEEEEDAEDN